MKEKVIILIFTILISYPIDTISQDTTHAKYFPLHIGNVYKYHVNILGSPGYDYNRRIIKDTVINSKRYFVLSQPFPGINGMFVRYDSTSGNIYYWFTSDYCSYSPFEPLIDSLRANINDSTVVCYLPYIRYCTDTNTTTLFGVPEKMKSYKEFNLEGYTGVTYGSNFGVVGATYHDFWSTSYHNVVGCYINGILYGDTTITGVQQISSEVPEKYRLFQNYPNPFNPTTKVKMQIAKMSDVKLIVYDALGREVAMLVNEQLKPGAYEVVWDASGYPSGVYFYKIEAGEFVETRKMVLLK